MQEITQSYRRPETPSPEICDSHEVINGHPPECRLRIPLTFSWKRLFQLGIGQQPAGPLQLPHNKFQKMCLLS